MLLENDNSMRRSVHVRTYIPLIVCVTAIVWRCIRENALSESEQYVEWKERTVRSCVSLLITSAILLYLCSTFPWYFSLLYPFFLTLNHSLLPTRFLTLFFLHHPTSIPPHMHSNLRLLPPSSLRFLPRSHTSTSILSSNPLHTLPQVSLHSLCTAPLNRIQLTPPVYSSWFSSRHYYTSLFKSGPLLGRLAYRKAIAQRLVPALRAFSPGLILISAGFDAALGKIFAVYPVYLTRIIF